MRISQDDDLNGAVVTLDEVLQEASIVLLGEPGTGKTTALEAVLTATGATKPIDGAALTEAGIDRQLLDRLRSLPAEDEPAGDPVLIAIDQVDESPMVARLGRAIRGAVSGRNTAALRIVLACRTADLPPDLINAVSEVAGTTLVADLMPLSRQEAIDLAASVTDREGQPLDGQSIVHGAVNAGAGALAAAPLTLGLLVGQFRATGAIKGSAAELFADGMARLLDEPDDEREFVGRLLIPERLAIAESIAVRLVLAGKRSIWLGRSGDEGRHDLSKHDAIGPLSPSGSNEAITEVLATALFAGRGDDRLGFAHGSYAAYLAASYLADKDPPEAQLRSMFLVPTGAERFAIPPPLRETAAWLVTLQTKHAAWLIDADVGSLVPHRSVLDSPQIRALLVDAALLRADELELEGTWEYRERSFLHPHLASQIIGVLSKMDNQDRTAWPSVATVRLALQIVAGETIPALAGPLLEVVTDDRWPAHLRGMAAWIAYDCDGPKAVPVLLEVLTKLDTKSDNDPLDELRASLVDSLWPDSLSSLDALTHIVRPRIASTIRSLDRLRHEFTERVPDAEFPGVLEAVAALADRPTVADPEGGLDTEDVVGAVPADLVHNMVDRAFSGPDPSNHLRIVARLCRHALAMHRTPPMPTPLAVIDEHQIESPETVRLRRKLALALVWPPSIGDDPGGAIQPWIVTDRWGRIQLNRFRLDDSPIPGYSDRTSLVDDNDFAWAYEQAGQATTPEERSVLTDLACQLLRYVRPDHTDLLTSSPGHPVYEAMRHLFEPMALDCEIAVRYRHQQARKADRELRPFTPEQASAFGLDTHRLLTEAMTDGERFMNLAHALQFDPVTGIGHQWLSDPLVEFPGTGSLDRLGDLTSAALQFINECDDKRTDWLATNTIPLRAWAANVALAHLHHQQRLDDISADAWCNWHGIVIEFRDHDHEARDTAQALLDRAYRADPDGLSDTVALYLRRNVNTGNWAHHVEHFEVVGRDRLADVLLEVLLELTNALAEVDDPPDGGQAEPGHDRDDDPPWISGHPDSIARALQLWRNLFPRIAQARPVECEDLAHALITGAKGGHRRLKTLGALGLLATNPVGGLSSVLGLATTDPDLGRQAAGWIANTGHVVEQRLDEAGAADLYRWLAMLYPPDADQVRLGASWVGDDEEGRRWRDRVLTRLSDRGTDAALSELEQLALDQPERLTVKAAVSRARRQIAERVWSPIEPDTVDRLLADPRRRIIDRDDQLAELVALVLTDAQNEMIQVSELLWDRVTTQRRPSTSDPWVPKGEAALGAFLTRELRTRLPDQLIDREVMVEPTNSSGAYTRVDLKVQALLKRPTAGHVPTVMVELKGSWHADVRTAQRTQLVNQYMVPTIRGGVYVVAWFPPDQWAEGDTRRRNGSRHTPESLRQFLAAQAHELEAEHGVRVLPVILDMRRPQANPNRDPLAPSQPRCAG